MASEQPAPAKKTDPKPAKGKLLVKVLSQFKVFFEGEATSISAENKTGPFDVLQGHANFLSLLKPGKVVIRNDDEKDTDFEVQRGIMHVSKDSVKIFLDV